MTTKSDATRERILQAALAEFATYGVAGARVDRIASTAGCNKNLIYVYFDNKETLFNTVLEKHLRRVYDDLAFTPDDLSGYAVRVFDFAMDHPALMRLMAWSSLESSLAPPRARTSSRDQKIAELSRAQKEGQIGDRLDPAFLLTMIMTLSTAWTAANPFGPALNPDAAERAAELRDTISAVVAVLVELRRGH